ncbi:HTH domain-containing protein [Ramlibacter sp. AW1]|uniref:HTH domain-containing protein n=1 Tax=Ramlibacter aurantiacus TaxID=2801330 RepID=A0A936ZG58_9BURK|nr:IclR family transcriptional regulator C-terminal domain-containing protein [Ramlibacter aurantiacus]MBL0419653.1 HTH domain-containing protein [Ramlibacter aurantiacus]
MTERHRMLRILEAFSLEQPIVTPAALMAHLGASRATIYRDLQQLAAAGLIERVDTRGYALGPRIVELDRQIRLADPLLQAAGELPAVLARDTNGIVLLCRLHDNKVMCILEVTEPDAPIQSSYQRGRAMPLYRGATSKAILAQLSRVQLGELVANDSRALDDAGLPHSADDLYEALAPLREQGHVVTREEVDSAVMGLAVPLLSGRRLLGSLSVVIPSPASLATEARALTLLKSASRRIEARIETAAQEWQQRGGHGRA